MTTRAKRSAKSSRIAALVGDDRELFKGRLKESLQEVLEAEMTEAVGAGPAERTADRTGYRSGYYSRGAGDADRQAGAPGAARPRGAGLDRAL